MTDKERLEDIKLKFNNTIDTILYVPYEDVKFLIELAERVEELEEERDEWKDTAQSYYMTNQELRERNKRYKQALEEINRLGWDSESFGGGYNFEGEIHAQAIKIAYEALEGSE